MRLADFILANIEPILAEWEVFARTIWPGEATDPATLRDDAEAMLRATVSDMRSGQTAAEQSEKSRGRDGDEPESRVNRASTAHGMGRVASGFDLAALLAEYRALRASVLRLWRESLPQANPNDLQDITRFNESIDQSLAAAVVAYTQIVDADRKAAVDEQVKHAREVREVNDALLVSSVRQNELMEQAEVASRAKDHFLAVLSHELRTPLTPVMLTVAAREMDGELPLHLREDLRMIRRNIELEVRLIDDLLDLSRITSGKLRVTFDLLDINDLVNHVCEMCRAHVRDKRIHLHCQTDPNAGDVVGDPGRLQQVFWNLVMNAAKFTPEGGHIYLTTENVDANAHDERVRVTVRDTGIGIAPDLLPRIFDPFEQGEAHITRQYGGLGLGLAISKRLIEQHRGSIRAETAGAGKGSTFVVELPALSRTEAEVADPGSSGDGNGKAVPLRVLVVEDHADTANVLRRLLSLAGHDVKAAKNAAEALALAAAHPFDVILSDLGLPDMTGYELMARVKALHGLRGIAMSGFGTREDIERSTQAGFEDHIVKPLNMGQLELSLRRIAPTA